MTIVQRFWRYLVLATLLVAVPAHAAVVWTPTKPGDCTAASTPSPCCQVAAPGSNPACLNRNTAGDLFSVRADFRSDGGTYTSGGDVLPATGFSQLGLGSIVYANCWSFVGAVVVPIIDITGKILTFRVYTTAGTQMSGAVPGTSTITCDIYGR